MKKLLVILFFTSFLILLSFSQITVSPLSSEHNVRAGEQFTEVIYIYGGNTTQPVSIELYQLGQDISGNFDYIKADQSNFLYTNWAQFPNSVTVSPGTSTPVEVNFNIPSNAPFGTYNFILMITPQVETGGTIGIIIRYAIRITVHIQGTTITNISVENVDVIPDEEGRPNLQATVVNGSSYDLIVSMEAILRDQNNKMIERFPLKSEYMEKNNISSQRILKGNKVVFSGQPKYLLSAGDYKINLFVNYSNRQRVFTYDLTVPEEGFNFVPPTELALLLDNDEFSFDLYPGAVKTFVVNLQNMSNQNVNVEVGARDFAGLTKDKSILSWLTLRSQPSFTINSQRTSRTIISINVPKEAEDGGYYGQIVFRAYNQDEELLSEKTVNIETLIGDTIYDINLVSTNYEIIENQGIFSVNVKNIGDRYIIPKGTISIIDEKGVSIGVYDLTPSSEEWLIPGQETLLIGEVPLITDENYRYIITLFNQDQRIKTFEGDLK
ncbi:hypothetical protein PW5551_09580 [Petrotoga sp. 9PW.55.5.1]|uniref:COG1470 family protein n=1 Tax=Petrotoga sp. 9PW.55.5.1 TaxID=1308979 RepID=UPI000DC2F385|nr:hypothetical protein [Petrotoga sp. 9PW.55.5.1]RAO98501.1 hypothetical protein PW5551_09580 [Petrotoga sp. 9PW.55.5.1]